MLAIGAARAGSGIIRAGGSRLDSFDIAVIGAGAAGMFCAGIAGQRGARVVLIDHAEVLAEKIRISGGGRCNFTNLQGDRPERYFSEDPRFARAALKAYPPRRFIELLQRRRIGYHEKHRGQLFCDDSAEDIIAMLRAECDAGGVSLRFPCTLERLRREVAPAAGLAPAGDAAGFVLDTSAGALRARRVVVATGGLSIPKIGATDLGYRLARQFGLRVVETRPALVPLTFDGGLWAPFAGLSGLSLEVAIRTGGANSVRFVEDLLFTHRGLSGPAVLQASTAWRPGEPLHVDLAPGCDLSRLLLEAKEGARVQVETVLAQHLPKRLAAGWLAQSRHAALVGRRIAEVGKRDLGLLAEDLRDWQVLPAGTEGYRKAEVTSGGVATDELDPRTLQALRVPGLHFIGEVVDVTGWLGGYNFQWAWSSAHAVAMAATA